MQEIITDASCDFPHRFFEENNITVVPLRIIFSDREFLSDEISLAELVERMEKEIPKTSQPSPKQFLDAIREKENPVIITLSSRLSGTYNSAKSAAAVAGKGTVVDSLQASTGLGLFIEGFMKGIPKQELLERIEIFGMPETLRNLMENGRIGKVKGFIGNLLGIRPLIELKEGELVPIGKARSVDALADEFFRRKVETEKVYVTHTMADVSRVVGRISENYDVEVLEASPLIASHLGKGAIFISYMKVV